MNGTKKGWVLLQAVPGWEARSCNAGSEESRHKSEAGPELVCKDALHQCVWWAGRSRSYLPLNGSNVLLPGSLSPREEETRAEWPSVLCTGGKVSQHSPGSSLGEVEEAGEQLGWGLQMSANCRDPLSGRAVGGAEGKLAAAWAGS